MHPVKAEAIANRGDDLRQTIGLCPGIVEPHLARGERFDLFGPEPEPVRTEADFQLVQRVMKLMEYVMHLGAGARKTDMQMMVARINTAHRQAEPPCPAILIPQPRADLPGQTLQNGLKVTHKANRLR